MWSVCGKALLAGKASFWTERPAGNAVADRLGRLAGLDEGVRVQRQTQLLQARSRSPSRWTTPTTRFESFGVCGPAISTAAAFGCLSIPRENFRDVAATHFGDAAAALVGERSIGMSLFYLGDHTNSRRHAETMLRRHLRPKDRSHTIVRFQFDPRIVSRTLLSKLLWAQGFPDQAMHEVHGVIEEATTVGHAMSLALALAQSACPVTLLTGDLVAADRFINLLLKHTMGACTGPLACLGRLLRRHAAHRARRRR